MQITVDPKGVLRRPDFHDGFLLGLRVDKAPPARRLVLWLKHFDGRLYKLVVPGIERLVADDFWEGNIVFDVTLRSGSQIEDRSIFDIHKCNPSAEAQLEWLSQLRTRINDENWTHLEISSSYGCRLRALSSEPLEAIELEGVTRLD